MFKCILVQNRYTLVVGGPLHFYETVQYEVFSKMNSSILQFIMNYSLLKPSPQSTNA